MHLMTDGRPCVRPDGHRGPHRSPEAAEHRRELNRRYSSGNAAQIAERQRRYYQANPDAAARHAEARTRWRQANPQQETARRRRRRTKVRARVFAHYGQQCACCGRTDQLTIDHVTGGGAEHREELWPGYEPSSHQMYAWLVRNNFPAGFQTLCAPCNNSKKAGERCRLNHAKQVAS